MQMTYFEHITGSGYEQEIRQLLALADKEFVPPLSSRTSTTQSWLTGGESSGGIEAYFSAMATQPVIVALENGEVTGFMAFKFDHTCEQIKLVSNMYASTCMVAPEHRGKGMMRKFYEEMIARFPDLPVFTRTWSTNASHMRVLEKLGFSLIARLPNHRGEGLDTVYFCREPIKS